jgi:hypothetical protein
MRKRNVITQDAAVPTVLLCDGHIARPNNRKQIDWWLLYFFPHFVSLFLITMSIHPSISLFLSLFVYYIFGSASVSIISSEFYSCWNFCVHKFQSLHIISISVEGGNVLLPNHNRKCLYSGWHNIPERAGLCWRPNMFGMLPSVIYCVIHSVAAAAARGDKRRKKQLAKLQTVWAWLDPFHLYVWWLLCYIYSSTRLYVYIGDWRMLLLYTAYIIYGAESIKCCVGNGSDSRYTLSTITIWKRAQQ